MIFVNKFKGIDEIKMRTKKFSFKFIMTTKPVMVSMDKELEKFKINLF
jgi:hypothetical protein